MSATNAVLRVPLDRASFQIYRDTNAVSAALGVGMISVMIARGWSLLGGEFLHPKDPALLLLAAFAGICVLIVVGAPVVPAWQLACHQTRVLRQDLPALVIDFEGIEDNASNYTLGRIPWAEIESIVITERYASRIKMAFPGVAITLKDQNCLLRKKSKSIAMWMQSDVEISQKRQVFIPQGRLAWPIEEVVRLANEWRDQSTTRETLNRAMRVKNG